MFGFDYCTSPDSVIATNIDVKPDIVTIQGDTIASAPAFIGYIYKIDGDKMYIGLKYNLNHSWLNLVVMTEALCYDNTY